MTDTATLDRPADTTTVASKTVPVTVDNFVRAETHLYFGNSVAQGGLGRFHHVREPMPIDHQTVIRSNRDTLYSAMVVDLDAGPVTVTAPDSGDRFMSLQLFDEDQYTRPTTYMAGDYTLTREKFGTRYAMAAFRTLINPTVAGDLDEVHALQDSIRVSQPGGPGRWEIPNWDPVSQKTVRDALLVLASTIKGLPNGFGSKDEVDPVQRLLGAAAGWGANPPRDAMYLGATPDKNDGETVYRLKVPANVPVDAFWSVSVYGADGYYKKNALDRYTLNNMTAEKEADGSVMIQFGGCDGGARNCIPIMPGWNYTVRLYRPRAEILDGSWKFPEAQPVG